MAVAPPGHCRWRYNQLEWLRFTASAAAATETNWQMLPVWAHVAKLNTVVLQCRRSYNLNTEATLGSKVSLDALKVG